MYAIQNIKTGKFVFGSDYCFSPPHQRTSFDVMLTYSEYELAELDFRLRRCGKNYRVVELEEIKVRRIIENALP